METTQESAPKDDDLVSHFYDTGTQPYEVGKDSPQLIPPNDAGLLAYYSELGFLPFELPDNFDESYFRRRPQKSKLSVVKPAGKTRMIDDPNEPMWHIGQSIHEFIKDYSRFLPNGRYGTKAGYSIYDNAAAHAENRYIASIDLKSAYDQVNFDLLLDQFTYWLRIGGPLPPDMGQLTLDIQDNAWRLILRYFVLSQRTGGLATGGPASPMLFNLCMQSLDNRLADMAEHQGFVYTRYMDDMTFSSDRPFPQRLRKAIKQEIRSPKNGQNGWNINTHKIRWVDTEEAWESTVELEDGTVDIVQHEGRPIVVTGVQINPGGNMQLPTRYQTLVRKYFYETAFNGGWLDESTIGVVRGLWGHVKNARVGRTKTTAEEDKIDRYYREIMRRYHRLGSAVVDLDSADQEVPITSPYMEIEEILEGLDPGRPF